MMYTHSFDIGSGNIDIRRGPSHEILSQILATWDNLHQVWIVFNHTYPEEAKMAAKLIAANNMIGHETICQIKPYLPADKINLPSSLIDTEDTES